jgi:mannose-6-phosphate isomerase class I
MSSLQSFICPLVPAFQRYAWGKPASDETGTVAAMFRAHASPSAAASLEPSTPFAEVWMGTHPNGPSEVEVGGGGDRMKLSEYLKEKGSGLQGYDGDLPYLFKVKCLRYPARLSFHHLVTHRFSPSATLSASSRTRPSSAPPSSTAPSPSTTSTCPHP